MILFSDETADSLYRGVLAEPDNDLQRLVLADRLEEIGQTERAEFMRLQIEIAAEQPVIEFDRREWELWARNAATWYGDLYAAQYGVGIRPPSNTPNLDEKLILIRRGFPAEAWGTLDGLRGGECGECSGRGILYTPGDDNTDDGERECHHCRGTGRTPGHLRELVRRWPIQRVVVTDREPFRGLGGFPSPWFSWVGASSWGEPRADHVIDDAVWNIMECRPELSGPAAKRYDSREAALTALSDALLEEAREEPATP